MVETTEHGGYPLFDHLRKILDGPLVWAPGVDGGVVLSLRGGDFLFECGQDIAIGYDSHDAENVGLVPRRELQLPRRDARGGGRAARRPSHSASAASARVLPRRPAGRVGCERVFEAGATTSSYLDALNPEQRAAATHPGGPLLSWPAPAPGKTTTLCARVAWLVDRGRGARARSCC